MLSNLHKHFLQYILKNSYVSTEEAIRFTGNITDEIGSITSLKKLVAEINVQIVKQELKIVLSTCEVTSDVSVTLLNAAKDDICKQQNVFTAAELEYFQLLMKEIITADNHRLQNIACFNLSDLLTTSLRKDNVEKLLNRCIQTGYLVQHERYVYLGPRYILEFAPYFSVHCKDFYALCHLCSEPIFTGKSCSSCKKMLHKHCIEKWLQKQKKCPSCKLVWIESEPMISQQEELSESENEP